MLPEDLLGLCRFTQYNIILLSSTIPGFLFMSSSCYYLETAGLYDYVFCVDLLFRDNSTGICILTRLFTVFSSHSNASMGRLTSLIES